MTTSPARLTALGDRIFEKYNCYPGEGERNHCLRLVEFAKLNARRMGVELDLNLTYLAAMLHDLGLMVAMRPGTSYLERTVELARTELDEERLDDETWVLLDQSLLYNHAIRPPSPLLPPAEAFRRAVFTEHSRGVQTFGVSRHAVRGVFRAIPWENFNAVLADFIWKTAVFEPGTIPKIFWPRGR